MNITELDQLMFKNIPDESAPTGKKGMGDLIDATVRKRAGKPADIEHVRIFDKCFRNLIASRQVSRDGIGSFPTPSYKKELLAGTTLYFDYFASLDRGFYNNALNEENCEFYALEKELRETGSNVRSKEGSKAPAIAMLLLKIFGIFALVGLIFFLFSLVNGAGTVAPDAEEDFFAIIGGIGMGLLAWGGMILCGFFALMILVTLPNSIGDLLDAKAPREAADRFRLIYLMTMENLRFRRLWYDACYTQESKVLTEMETRLADATKGMNKYLKLKDLRRVHENRDYDKLIETCRIQ